MGCARLRLLLGGLTALLAAAAQAPVGCGVPPRFIFAELRDEYKNQNFFPVGKTAKYSCRPGYGRVPRISPTIECIQNGRWMEAPEFCKRKSCGHPGELQNGKVDIPDLFFGSTINFTCEEGHRLIGSHYSRCEISGTRLAWSHDVPICERIPCHPPPDITNGSHTGVLMEEFTYGTAVTYTCNKGHPLTGEASIHCTSKDGVTGEWNERPPRCGEIRCPAPRIQNGRRVPGDRQSYSYKDRVTFECDPSYTMKGHGVSWCQTDDTWDPPVPVCEPVRRCPSPPAIDNGKPSGQPSDDFTRGTSVIYSCSPGYSLLGEATVRCTESGAWSQPLPRCEVTCVSPAVENGRTNGVQLSYTPRDVVLFECDPGYTLNGSAETRCQEDGSWDPPIPVCERTRCESPVVENGRTNGVQLIYRPRDVVLFECDPGYTLNGSTKTQCQEDGSWDPPIPVCERRDSCITPEIQNGRRVGGQGPVYRPRDMVRFECNLGYTLNDSRPIQCRDDRTWDPPVPVCLQQKSGCGVPKKLSFAELKSEYKNQSDFPVGKTVLYVCRPGYSRYPGQQVSVTCLENGSWSEAVEFCKRKSCGHPGEPENGRVLAIDLLFGSTVNFTCDDGHRLIGQPHSRCEISGARVAWSNDVPLCERIPCSPPPEIPKGRHTGSHKNNYFFGSAVTYSCDKDHRLFGEASIHCTTVDGLNGVWSAPPPHCRAGCGVPTKLSFAELKSEYKNQSDFPVGKTVSYVCRLGYSRHPGQQVSVTCLENGSWSEAVEFCKRKSCPHPGDPQNGRVLATDLLFGSTVNFTCDKGHRLIGQPYSRCEISGARVAWSNDVPLCERISCPPPPNIPNGSHTGVLMEEFTYGTAVIYTCNKGHQLIGEASIYCTSKDEVTGEWNERPPRCGVKRCPPPPVIVHGKAGVRALDVFTSGMSVTYRCDPGYSLLGEATVHCTESGAWSLPLPQCEARCISPTVENGRTNGFQLRYRPRDVVLFKCDPGYTLNGSAKAQCQEDGSWDPPIPVCERKAFCITPDIRNGRRVGGQGPVYRPRDTIRFECNLGYTLNDSRPIRCGDDGTWDPPVPVCLQQKSGCGVPTKLSFAELKSEYKNQSDFPVGKTVSYVCRPGYSRHPRQQTSVTCLENGSWSEAVEFCKRKSCANPGDPQNGRVIATELVLGSTIHFTCDEGHRLIGQPYSRCEVSGMRVAWSDDVPLCKRISCPPPPDIPNGSHTAVLMEEFTYGTAVIYTCNNGHPLIGAASIHCTSKDGVTGEWNERPPRCGEVRCPAPRIQNGRRVPGDRQSYSYKDRVTFECDPSYTMKGHGVSWCQTDDTWDPPVPVCEPVKRCPPPPVIVHGKAGVRASDVFTSGMSVTYRCDPGYSLLGEATVHCTESGAWSRLLPQCEAVCVSPAVENGKTNGAQPSYRPRDVVLFECDPGYTLNGRAEIQCQEDGSWDPPVPVCERMTCESPVVENGRTNGVQLSYTPRDVVLFECDPGYTLNGSTKTQCQEDGSWDPPIPICERMTCESPVVENGRTNGVQLSYKPRDVVLFECDPGYSLNGSAETECQEDGSWDPPIPVCERVKRCPPPPVIVHGKAGVQASDVFTSGMSVTYRCDPGYSLLGEATVHCTESGAWSRLLPQCEAVCVSPAVENGKTNGAQPSYRPRDVVLFECDPGYTLNGSAEIQCQEDGSWDPPVPVCERTRCESPVVENGRTNGVQLSYTPRDVVLFECDPGYTLNGSTKTQCQEDGSWDPPIPICERMTCESPVVENGRTNGVQLSYKPRDVVLFECDPGYSLNGSAETECQEDGSWDPPIPVCERVKRCPPPPVIVHGKAGVQASDVFTSGMSVTYRCDPGYSLLGEATVHCTESGAWSRLLPQCEAVCVSPAVENGKTNGAQPSYRPRDVVLFECDPGYTLNGSAEIQCQEDGSWDPPVPVCERMTCESPVVENGRTNGVQLSYTPRDVVLFECDPGYTLNGSTKTQCQEDGSWDPPIPICERMTCESPVVENGRTNGVQLSYKPRDVVLFECDPGYSLNGSAETECQEDGSWDPPIPVCERVKRCPPPPVIVHGKAGVQASDVFTSGMSVTYRCDPGYSLLGEATVHCTESGAWSRLLPQCEAVCVSPAVENGKTNGAQPSYRPRDVVLFECDPGYTLNGSAEIQCQEDGSWDPPVPVCERTRCESPVVENGRTNGVQLSYTPRDVVLFECDPGYTLNGSTKTQCQEDGSWDPPIPICERMTCESPVVENGRTNGVQLSYKPRDVVLFECDPGYSLNGSAETQCQEDGSWDPPMPVCERVKRCPPPPVIVHGKAGVQASDVFTSGMSVTYRCDPGYSLLGEATVHCTESGAWSRLLPQCEAVCVSPAVENGKTNGAQPSYRPRDVVLFECDPGYTLNGSAEIQCQEDGSWDPPVPVCERTRCESPVVENGRTNGVQLSYTPRDVVLFECDPGYTLNGSTKTQCQEDGSWDPPIPICERMTCESPVVENGRTNGVQLSYKPRDVVLFECDPGYSLNGSAETECQEDGSWDPPIPVCERVKRCPPPPVIVHGKAGVQASDVFTSGMSVTYRCDPGYSLLGEATVHCTESGAWSRLLPQCEAVCVSPAVENGKTNGAQPSYRPRDVVLFECDPGYTLNGSAEIQCQEDGSWDPPVPVCERTRCESPVVENGRTNGVQLSYTPRDVVLFECDPGYTLNGSTKTQCQEDGSWDPPIPICERMTCESPVVENGRTNGVQLSYKPRDVVLFECDPGYSLNGSAETQCQEDGSWDPPMPVCERVKRCPPPPVIVHGKAGVQASDVFTSGMSVTYRCDPGYSLLGEATVHCTESGAWSRLLPQCEAKCMTPAVESGRMNGVEASYRPRDVVLFECDPGYTLNGSAEIQCQEDGSWDPPIPVCERARCESPVVENGRTNGVQLSYKPRDVVLFECDPGYSLNGSAKTQCQEDGSWDPPIPVCELSEKAALAAGSYNFLSEALGIMAGMLLLLLVLVVTWTAVSKMTTGYYYTHESNKYQVPLTHVIEQKTSSAP